MCRQVGFASLVVFLVLGDVASASTRHYRGVITHVSPDGPTIKLSGVNIHSSAESVSELGSSFHKWAIFAIDNRIVPARQALVKGRQYCGFHEGAVQVLSEEADIHEGRVAEVSDKELTLDVVMMVNKRVNPPKDVTRPVRIPLEKPADVRVGQTVRVTPARGAVVDALSRPCDQIRFPDTVAEANRPAPKAKSKLMDTLDDLDAEAGDGGLSLDLGEKPKPKPIWVNNVWVVVEGLVKALTEKELELWMFRDGKAQVVKVPRNWPPSFVLQDANPVKAEGDPIAPGRWVAYAQVSKRGGKRLVGTHVWGVSKDDGRVQGLLRRVEKGALTLTTLTVDGPRDITVTPNSPKVRLDGRPSTLSDLRPGMPVVVFSPRPQTVTVQ